MLPYPLSRRPDLTNGVTRYAALTTLRDPIERIGSQAFYKQGVGLNILQQEAKRLCGKMSVFYSCKTQPERDGCDCYRNVMNSTKAILKNNETLWFQWINQSTPGNFMGDFYSSNYYIKRIGRSKLSKMHRTVAKCLRQVSACDKVKSSSAAIVKNFGHSALCGAEDVDVVEGLEVAKVLLRDHFEFILTERFVEKYTTDIISKVLHDPSFLLNHHHLNVSKENFGHVSAVASYTSFMPAAVLEFLHEDNKYDIMLYRYAVELYNERYGFPDS